MAYDQWSEQYDSSRNRTRDLEALAIREVLADGRFQRVLEIGCGTGKNTEWLVDLAGHVTAVDLSEGMLAIAREKIRSPRVRFVQADILQPWSFTEGNYDLVTFSLVLEHIEDLAPVLQKTADVLAPNARVYIGELHPIKQYLGTKARFGSASGTQVVTCHDHHISDFISAAQSAGLSLEGLREFFDADDDAAPPRVLTLLLKK